MNSQKNINIQPLGNKPTKPTEASAIQPLVGSVGLFSRHEKLEQSEPDPLRWPRFVGLCKADGVTESEVQSMFREQDIDDLCFSPDASLPKFAATIVGAIKSDSSRYREPPTQARTYTERHRCGRCQNYSFNPTSGSLGLGWCNVRTDVTMAVPSRLIECDQYQQRTPTP